MLKFVILSLSLVLSGCYTTITKDQVTLGNKFCEDKGGVSHIVVYDLINNYTSRPILADNVWRTHSVTVS